MVPKLVTDDGVLFGEIKGLGVGGFRPVLVLEFTNGLLAYKLELVELKNGLLVNVGGFRLKALVG